MTQAKPEAHAGGCQCGAVRFRVDGPLGTASICHCRMCQKAFGAFYAPLVSVPADQFTWTRGMPRRFQSSNHVARGFCADCGTPLTYEAPGDTVALAIGAFDNPADVAPTIQYGTEGKLSFVDRLDALPSRDTQSDFSDDPFLASIKSYQHPDHDTAEWPVMEPRIREPKT